MGRKKAPIEELIENAVADDEPNGNGLVTVMNEPAVDFACTRNQEEENIPDMTDPGWQDYVLQQFDQSELDPQGNPFADALRRVTEKLCGPIIAIVPRTVQTPENTNGYRATVEMHVSIAWGGNRDDIRTFGNVADVYPGNTDAAYARHAAATAATKAEGRCYRAALKLKRIYASEELTTVPVSEAGLDKYIVATQNRFIDNKCKELDIDVFKFINSGEFKYKHISHIKYERAQAMVEMLSAYNQDKSRIPESIKGYVPNWNNGGLCGNAQPGGAQ